MIFTKIGRCALLFQLIHFFVAINAQDYACPPSNSDTPLGKLKDSVLCNYDTSVRPVANHEKAMNVSFRLVLKYFTYDPISSMLSLDAWLTVTWKDDHLTWKPEQYQNIKNLHLHTSSIWTPDLSVYNMANQGEDPEVIGSAKCLVTYKGVVLCVPPIHIDALCVADLSHYPFDTQNCSLQMGSWVHKGEELNIKLMKNVVNMDDLIHNGEWKISSYSSVRNSGKYACCPNDTYPSIEISFKVKRLSGSHAAGIVIPILADLILSFVFLSLSPLNKERLVLSYVTLLAQFIHVQFLTWQIPLKGDNIPLLLTFSRDSILMTVFAILFTLLFRDFMQRKTTPPAWISSIVSGVISCRPGQIILLSDYSTRGVASAKKEEDGTTIVSSDTNASTNNQDWVLFGNILDKILLILYVIIYFTMMIAFIP
ncbi:unnamed protein product [Phaedon cochleariae]|uniref:Neurotransmitter-gated ion-channel ligand-binding domain-containing protein n=1 Tax=Phaedon cochleariae TaxID=80249 RepID=A0A9P0DM88_PHACE|nr:unnamed protein product [Phaedon cochleariae]